MKKLLFVLPSICLVTAVQAVGLVPDSIIGNISGIYVMLGNMPGGSPFF